ncbi:hypothetical protein PanWU01x14_106140 [Parasponia andersonii]|uniref:Uncharacterized protein n=1 Tax=Parasponia andersonii TaxID=3476 RepID=A0A2P5D152_PARAD|nr:hypothetical protein PanWU01x14_106140 [Parasponia andersonii]
MVHPQHDELFDKLVSAPITQPHWFYFLLQ